VEEPGGEVKKQVRPMRGEDDSAGDYALPRRLVICLDGTWNKRESGTNIYHLANLVQDGKVEDGERQQLVYYDEGVGTGVLDNVTGGAFGIGLSANVREAYDWLVENYRDRPSTEPQDEIYVFGFSRGAFTARSLTGLIANFGLLYRGAPLPPAQLWNAYKRSGVAKRAGKEPPVRRLPELKRDPWAGQHPQLIPPDEMNATERLLVHWSRRVPIRCLGVFDTVGALGIEALAIPWLQEKRAAFHDTHLSAIVVNAFQALAIDEHRASFAHVPWTRRTAKGEFRSTVQHGTIEQRWFIGAHANVGGGEDDNVLAQLPLRWMRDECRKLGLVFKPRTAEGDPPLVDYPAALQECIPLAQPLSPKRPAHIADSFTVFLRGAWRFVARAKRNYRRIDPPPECEGPHEVQSINEVVDPSVLELARLDREAAGRDAYQAPNLWEYLNRNGLPAPTAPLHDYGTSSIRTGWLWVWLSGVGAGGLMLGHVLDEPWPRPWAFAVAAVVIALAADWTESRVNHTDALSQAGTTAGKRRKTILHALLVVRLVALLLAGVGLAYWAFVAATR
jgi:uncharacterized protein (DUF2235 family)